MKHELFIALRFLVGRRKEKFISIITVISILGVAIGVASLIIVLAVMNGFDNTLKEKIVSANYQVIVDSARGINENAQPLYDMLKAQEGIAAQTPFINGQAIVKTPNAFVGVIVRGIEPSTECDVTKIGEYVVAGSLRDLADGKIILGNELANNLGLDIGDQIILVSPVKAKNFNFTVTAIFNSGMYDYDAGLVFVNIKSAQELYNAPGTISGIGIRVDNIDRAFDISKALQQRLGIDYWVKSWTQLNKNLFGALKLEKVVMFIILTLIVLVACFNIVATLIMLVMEKTKDIGVLKAIGSTNKSIMRIFVWDGLIIGFSGTAFGLGLGLGLAYLLKKYQFVKLPKDIYYIDTIPVMMDSFYIGLIIAASIIICLIATIYPSIQAARLKTVDALRYE